MLNFNEVKKKKQAVLKVLEDIGHRRLKGISQCVYMMLYAGQTYGLIILSKNKPGFKEIHKRLEHGIDEKHIRDLQGENLRNYVLILEHSAGRMLIADIEALVKVSYKVKGEPVMYFPREALTDITHVFANPEQYTGCTLDQLCDGTRRGGDPQKAA